MTKTPSERIAALKTVQERTVDDILCSIQNYDALAPIAQGLDNQQKQLLAQALWDVLCRSNKESQEIIEALEVKVKELEGKGWLPIESEAKDPDRVLVYNKNHGCAVAFSTGVNYRSDIMEGEDLPWEPTHFMLLPPKPNNLEE